MIVYKYRSLSEAQNQKGESAKFLTSMILNNTSLWFARPDTLNDPLDSQISIKELSTRILEDKPTNPFITYPKKSYISIYRTEYLKHCEDIDNYQSTHGVLSLCISRENLVMWSHYADEYRGICFGFDLNILAESVRQSNLKLYGNLPVKYCEETPLLKVLKDALKPQGLGLKENKNLGADLFKSKMGSKHIQWSYEQEYRLLTDQFGSCAFAPQALKEVILGHAMSEKNKSEIVELIKDKFPHVKIYDSFFNSTFKLHFKMHVKSKKTR